jgi:imidazolonepropionase
MRENAEQASTVQIFTGISTLLTMDGRDCGLGAPAEARLARIDDAALVTRGESILWLGPRTALPDTIEGPTTDLGGRVVLPGLVDPHTHLVYAGDRAADFEARARGETYAAIAARGGGIRTTVRATRAATDASLLALARGRLARLLEAGVTTVEVKSGYGLTIADELRQLEVVRDLGGPQRLVPTLLLHVIPDEFIDDRAGWVDLVRQQLLPEARRRRLASQVDVFCETSAFSPAEAQSILSTAIALGFEVKAHSEQLSASGFGAAAASMGALSLEHLEHASDAVIQAMSASGTVAVLLPTASLFLGDAHKPPVAALRHAGVRIAIGTDLNPGSSPNFDPWLAGTLACTWYGLTPAESLLGMTVHAAQALGLDDGTGCLSVGGPADFIVAHCDRWEGLLYGLGHRPIDAVWLRGREVARGGRLLGADREG